MPVREYCRKEPRTATADESLREVAKRLAGDGDGVGCVVVVDAQERPVGIVTDRDLALQVLRGDADADADRVGDFMTAPVVTVTDHARLRVAIRFMRRDGLRRIPVVDRESGKLVGILTADDVVPLLARELTGVAQVMWAQYPADLRAERALPSAAGGR